MSTSFRARIVPNFPASVVGEGTIYVEKKNGIYKIYQNPLYPLADAPIDGRNYMRRNGSWDLDPAVSGKVYGVADGAWVEVPSMGDLTVEIDGVEARLDDIDAELIVLDGRLDALEPRVTALESAAGNYDSAYVNVAGDVMSGMLHLPAANPTLGTHATHKTYVDGQIISHTHAASAITDFAESVDDRVNALFVAGTNITKTYDDAANTLTISAAGGGGGVAEAPTDGQLYSRQGSTASWQVSPGGAGGGICKAPNDGALYGRMTLGWQKGVRLAGDTMIGTLAMPASGTAAGTVLNFGTPGTGLYGSSTAVVAAISGTSKLTLNATLLTSANPIVLPADPASPLHAATKAYADLKEPALPGGGTTSTFLRGDKTWAIPAGGGGGGREVLTADRNYYVATTGNDSNDGKTVGAPWLTLNKAWNVIRDTIDGGGFNVLVYVANGTYTENLDIDGDTTNIGWLQFRNGGGTVTLNGTGPCISVSSSAPMYFDTWTLNPSTNASCIQISKGATVHAMGCTFNLKTGVAAARTIEAGTYLYIWGPTVVGSGGAFIDAYAGGSIALNGTVTFSAITVTDAVIRARGGVLDLTNATFAGTATGKRYECTYGGAINLVTQSETLVPGTVAGTVDALGSRYGSFPDFAVSDTPPATPVQGKGWFESDTGNIYVWYDDGSSGQWIQVNSPVVQTADLRNRIVNGAMQISQENGDTASQLDGYYAADQWTTWRVHGGVITSVRYALTTPNGSAYRYRLYINTGDAALAAGDHLTIMQYIEAGRISDFRWGTVNAKQAILRFGFKGPAGTYSISLRNSPITRSYLASFTISAGQANTDTEQVFIIPGDTTTWTAVALTAPGLILCVTLAAGTTHQGAVGWQNGSLLGTAAGTNGMATTASAFELFDVGLYLDAQNTGVAPRWEMPDEADELIACMRYYTKLTGLMTTAYNAAGGAFYMTYIHPVKLRVVPAMSLANTNYSNAMGLGLNGTTVDATRLQAQISATGSGWAITDLIVNARM